MNCSMAVAVLRGLTTNQLDVTTEQIEELLALGLAVEADADDLAALQWLSGIVQEHAGTTLEHPHAALGLASALQETEQELATDWYRMKASKVEIRAREESRVTMRRALAFLGDGQFMASARKNIEASRQVAPSVRWVCCEKLGSELYAITHKGWRVLRKLEVRLDRYAEAQLRTFLAASDKTDGKMRALADEIGYLNQNIGYVKKNREQIVIGLAKMGESAPHAIGTYHWRLEQAMGRAETAFKHTARLMPATGTPEELVRRVVSARRLLDQVPGQANIRSGDGAATAVALAAMVRDEPAILVLVQRFRAVQAELLRAGITTSQHCEADALECVACPGTPTEVVDIVSTLAQQIAQGRRTERADVAVAVSFAKRFSL